ncbi:hypothetical protein NDU88_000921 [Pleurodeles waltl]|uniref:Uncharacterized protein n=1 Tax=Pleurodeles waltl TaxID=8319 RepID=A0AAV7TH41_PLEWA|nr:hypothetical protein NDU88_000921 [Pleurodeles waltl]
MHHQESGTDVYGFADPRYGRTFGTFCDRLKTVNRAEVNAVTGLPPAERVTEATMDSIIKKCPGGTSNRSNPATSWDFWGREEEQGTDDSEERKEDTSNQEDVGERKDT